MDKEKLEAKVKLGDLVSIVDNAVDKINIGLLCFSFFVGGFAGFVIRGFF